MLLGRAYSSKRGKPTFNKGILKSALTRLQGLQKRRVGEKIVEQGKNTCPLASLYPLKLTLFSPPSTNTSVLTIYLRL